MIQELATPNIPGPQPGELPADLPPAAEAAVASLPSVDTLSDGSQPDLALPPTERADGSNEDIKISRGTGMFGQKALEEAGVLRTSDAQAAQYAITSAEGDSGQMVQNAGNLSANAQDRAAAIANTPEHIG